MSESRIVTLEDIRRELKIAEEARQKAVEYWDNVVIRLRTQEIALMREEVEGHPETLWQQYGLTVRVHDRAGYYTQGITGKIIPGARTVQQWAHTVHVKFQLPDPLKPETDYFEPRELTLVWED